MMQAWHNDPELRERTIAALHRHRADDRYIQGQYLELYDDGDDGLVEWRGCHIGCLVKSHPAAKLDRSAYSSRWHTAAETLYGIPKPVAHLWDRMFETHTPEQAADFAVTSVEAVAVGADLRRVPALLTLDLLDAARPRLVGYPKWIEHLDRAVADINTDLAEGNVRTCEEEDAYCPGGTAIPHEGSYPVQVVICSHRAATHTYYGHDEYYADVFSYAAGAVVPLSWIVERLLHHTRSAPVGVAA